MLIHKLLKYSTQGSLHPQQELNESFSHRLIRQNADVKHLDIYAEVQISPCLR